MSRRNVETYANDQQALCRQNDFIPDSLFREYGVNRVCGTSTAWGS